MITILRIVICFPWNDCSETFSLAVNQVYTIAFGMTKHQTIEQSQMTLVFGWFLLFHCLDESIYLQNNTYNKIKQYNTMIIKIGTRFFS